VNVTNGLRRGRKVEPDAVMLTDDQIAHIDHLDKLAAAEASEHGPSFARGHDVL
jgi:LmbE family N-acetylglucosaminyl deacetylase